jgi:CDP-diacylglycerol--glycerol-3-phosphate 3-phosphatidyltransferase/cardiolipin synthase
MNLPNQLTMARVVAVPFFIVLYLAGQDVWAAVLFIAASATDALDGYLARKHNLVSNFGKIMDPLADKVLVISALVLLVETGDVAGWMVIVILAREFAVAGLRTVAASEGVVIAAGTTGKIKTILQMLAVPLLLLQNWPFSYLGFPMDQVLLWACVIMTIVSGTEYIVRNISVFKN